MSAPPTLVCMAVGPDRVQPLAQLHTEAFDKSWNAEDLARSMTGAGAFAVQAAVGEDVLGFVIARAMAGEAEIITLAVRPSAHRGGIGRALMLEAIATALTFGATVMWLEVAVDNRAAVGLYQALGFETAGRRKSYYARDGERIDALIMRRALNSATG